MNATKENKKETNIQVVVRIRPPSEKEILDGYPISITPKGSNQVVAITPHATTTRTFSFDKVFSQHDNQATIYSAIVSPMIKEVLDGYNCTIFAYGQTGTGKTYTMEGDLTEITKDDIIIGKDCGMIPRALDELFNYLNQDGIEYSLRVSCIEIYNEQLKDLLTSDTSLKLQFYENSYKKVTVKNLEEIPVKNVYDAIQLFQKGMNERKTASTNYNERSSRSHCVYSITVHITENSHGQDMIKVGKLNLVDLAGSESIGRSGAENKQAREAGMINQSLLALGRVINSLVDKAQHIPYRESKLTRLLQDSLGGKTKTCIIATVAPTRYSIEESLSTLDYAFRAKNIRNKPEVNQHMTKKALIQDYMNEIKQLKNLLRCAREKDGVYLSNEDYNQLKFSCSANNEENKRLKKLIDDQEQEISQLKHSIKDKANEIQDLENQIDKNLQIIMQKERDITNISQQLLEEGVLLKSHMLSEDNLNIILNDMNNILKNCSLELYKYHLFADNKLSLEKDNREIFASFRNHIIHLMENLINRVDIIKSQNNYYDQFLFQSIQAFINEKIKSLNEISFNINNNMNEYEDKINNFKTLSSEYHNSNADTYQLMNDKNSEFMNNYSVLFNNFMEHLNSESSSFNKTFSDKSTSLNIFNEKIKEEIGNLKQDLSSFINIITNQVVSIKDSIINQKNKEIKDLKNIIEFIKNQKSKEIQNINKDKDELLNKIKGLIEDFSNSRQKVFNETIEPVTLNLDTMSNEMGSELEYFNNQFTEIETNINVNDALLNGNITSFNSNISAHQQDNIDFINKSKDKYNEFSSLLKDNMDCINNRFIDYNKLNGDLLQDLERKSNNYKNNTEIHNNTILTELEDNRMFINSNYNNNIKSYREYLGSAVYNNNENERIKIDNYNNCQSLSEQLHNELVKSNTIFKENPLLNEAPEKNKYYNIYSWKTTPEHDNILSKYRELCIERERECQQNLNTDDKEVVNDVSINNDDKKVVNDVSINNDDKEAVNDDKEVINDKETAIDDTINKDNKKDENKNEIDDNNDIFINNENGNNNDIIINDENRNGNENIEVNVLDENKFDNNLLNDEEKFENDINNKDNDVNDFIVNDISIKKVLFLSHDNVNYDYKEMKIEELVDKDTLFNNAFENDNQKEIIINDTLSSTDKEIFNVSEENSSYEKNDLLNDISLSNEKALVNEFESSDNQILFIEQEKSQLGDEGNESNSEDVGTIEIVVNESKDDDLISDSDNSSVSHINDTNEGVEIKFNNNNSTKSIQKMDSAIELEDKINTENLKLKMNMVNNAFDIKSNIDNNIDNSNINNTVRDSLITRKTFKNQKPLAGFNFTEKKRLVCRSSSVPNTPTIVHKLQKSSKSKDDLSLKKKYARKYN